MRRLFGLRELLIVIILCIVLGLAAAGAAIHRSKKSPSSVIPLAKNSVPYIVLANGAGLDASALPSGIRPPEGLLVVTNQQDLQNLLNSLKNSDIKNLNNLMPDFSKHTIIFVTREVVELSAWQISDIGIMDNNALVYTNYVAQGQGCTGLPAFSQHFYVIDVSARFSDAREVMQKSMRKACH